MILYGGYKKMIGNLIQKSNNSGGGNNRINPDDYFDPTTHIATERNFIKFINDGGYFRSSIIGYKVQLSNTVSYNNGIWVIADINHDVSRTGQPSTFDLISEDCIGKTIFGGSTDWRSSTIRSYMNNTFYPGFSSVMKEYIINIRYQDYQSGWFDDDYCIIPAGRYEVQAWNGSYGTFSPAGTIYPYFCSNINSSDTNTNALNKNYNGSSSWWWTRSLMRDKIHVISTNGGTYLNPTSSSPANVGLIRVQI